MIVGQWGDQYTIHGHGMGMFDGVAAGKKPLI